MYGLHLRRHRDSRLLTRLVTQEGKERVRNRAQK